MFLFFIRLLFLYRKLVALNFGSILKSLIDFSKFSKIFIIETVFYYFHTLVINTFFLYLDFRILYIFIFLLI